MTSSSQLIDSVANTTAHKDRDDLDRAIARLLLRFLEADSVSIFRLRDDDGSVRIARRTVMSDANQDGDEGGGEDAPATLPTIDEVPAWRRCIQRREMTQHTDASGRTLTVFAIEGEHDVIGLLEIVTRSALRSRDGGLVSGILRIMKNHVALLDYGERDTLTGLFNRKVFDSSFEKLRARMRREDAQRAEKIDGGAAPRTAAPEPSWLAIADIDSFKSINDTYGHLFGDEVLLLVAQLMKKSFRGGDLLFRFGGEEFVVVLERASPAGAAIAFERLRTEIESFKFPQVEAVTLSLGYTRIDPHEASTTCIERADAALYFAKHHGRNTVCSYEALVASGELRPKSAPDEDIELF